MTSFDENNQELEMKETAARICRDYLSGAWKFITADEINLKRISGGLSNFLYYVSLPDNYDTKNINLQSPKHQAKRLRQDSIHNSTEPKEVLLRIYGQTHGENALETMLTESVVFTLLSERNLGPKLNGIFPGGRIEQYIPARPLSTMELSDYKISMKIAEKMAEIHSLDIPISKEPDWLWNTMDRWLKTIQPLLKNNITKANTTNRNNIVTKIQKTDFEKEVQWLKSIIKNTDYPVVFSHNDLQEGNILLKEDTYRPVFSQNMSDVCEDSTAMNIEFNDLVTTEKLNDTDILFDAVNTNVRKRFKIDDGFCELDNTRDSVISNSSDDIDPDLIIIDYEYCAYNYRGFDLANHFIEWTIDYKNPKFPFFSHERNQYPSKMQQGEFITAYLSKLSGNNMIPNIEEINGVYKEIKCFTMVSHLFWCLWSIVNVHQNIEFGYWDYASCRLREYFEAKENFISSREIDGERRR